MVFIAGKSISVLQACLLLNKTKQEQYFTKVFQRSLSAKYTLEQVLE